MSATTPRRLSDESVLRQLDRVFNQWSADAKEAQKLQWVRNMAKAITFGHAYPNVEPRLAQLIVEFRARYQEHGTPEWKELARDALYDASELANDTEVDDDAYFEQMLASDAAPDAFVAPLAPAQPSPSPSPAPLPVPPRRSVPPPFQPTPARAVSLAPIAVEDVPATESSEDGEVHESGDDEIVEVAPPVAEPVVARRRKGESDREFSTRMQFGKAHADALVTRIQVGEFDFQGKAACDYCAKTARYQEHGTPEWKELARDALYDASELANDTEVDDDAYFEQMLASDAAPDAFVAPLAPAQPSPSPSPAPLPVPPPPFQPGPDRAVSLAPIAVEDVPETESSEDGEVHESGDDEIVEVAPPVAEPVVARRRKGESDREFSTRMQFGKAHADALVTRIQVGEFDFQGKAACDYCAKTGSDGRIDCRYKATLKPSGWTVECEKCRKAKKGCQWSEGEARAIILARKTSAATGHKTEAVAPVAGHKRAASTTPDREDDDPAFKAPKRAHATTRKETRASAQGLPLAAAGFSAPLAVSGAPAPTAMEVDAPPAVVPSRQVTAAPQDAPIESQTQRTVPGSERVGSWVQEVAEWKTPSVLEFEDMDAPVAGPSQPATARPTASKGKGKGKALRRHLLPPGPRPRDFAALPAVASLQHLITGPIESVDGTQTAESIALIVQATRTQRANSVATILAQGRIAIDNWWGDVGLINPPLWRAYMAGQVPRIMREEDEWYEVDEE
ncbi:hypothetical protein FA95DRAFT_1614043 [Auriscalpium vulgare]|uniref:Uncharacterized protein n=1 Tax=Auriscalpium vulgare TaxID=40419 RepID=A0ACB8R0G0_9AGAM|nr:hypothetical protein FA95DRAFT_1614043 [Auriscalpium vulgare]